MFLILLLFHLFSGGRLDRARCFKCHILGHWARECTATGDSARSAYRGTAFTPGYSYSSYRPTLRAHSQSGTTPTILYKAVMFLMTTLLIALVQCDCELFEFELSTSSPSVNVRGNLRRNLDFWKLYPQHYRRGYLLPFVSFPEPAVFKNNRSSLSHAQFVEEAIRDLVESGCVAQTKVGTASGR